MIAQEAKILTAVEIEQYRKEAEAAVYIREFSGIYLLRLLDHIAATSGRVKREKAAWALLRADKRYTNDQFELGAPLQEHWDMADAILALPGHLAPEPGWEPITDELKDGRFIVYLGMDRSRPLKDPYFCGRAVWIDADEGQREGWYDDSISDYIVPIAYLPYPPPPLGAA